MTQTTPKPRPTDVDIDFTAAVKAHDYWFKRSEEIGDPDDYGNAIAWARRAAALHQSQSA